MTIYEFNTLRRKDLPAITARPSAEQEALFRDGMRRYETLIGMVDAGDNEIDAATAADDQFRFADLIRPRVQQGKEMTPHFVDADAAQLLHRLTALEPEACLQWVQEGYDGL